MENEAVSLWNKKADELTVGETVKFSIGATVVTAAVTFGALAIAGGVAHLVEKRQNKQAAKLKVVNDEG